MNYSIYKFEFLTGVHFGIGMLNETANTFQADQLFSALYIEALKMQMEDFYAAEKDADILIYNGTIEGELTSIDELVQKNSLFADFKAVKSGQVYTTGSNFYQQSTGTCDFIEDLNQILTGEGDGTYRFLKKLQ